MGKKIQCIGRYVMDGKTLGKGTFGKVELATHGVTGCKVAIKIIDTRKIKEEYVQQNLHREARILGQLRHPNIIRLYETLKATTLYCLVLECAAGGDLLAYIKTHKENCLPEEKVRVYMRQLISAVHYLHERGVAHRDLKMENIMLDEKKRNIKLVDFGLSNTFTRDELMKTHCGSLEYAAPELFEMSEKYGPEIDIWALGVIMYAMLVGKLPFTTAYTDQYRRQKLFQQIERGLVEIHEREMIHLTKDCKNLLKKLLEPSSDLRLPLLDVEIHPWVTQGVKSSFHTFHKYPKDKTMKSQVIEELSSLLQMKKEEVETTVHESKCDQISAMFNMMMDCKREEKGIFDIDYTVYQMPPPEKKTKRKKKHHSHSKSDKDVQKESEVHGDEGHDEEHKKPEGEQHRVSTAFDFMAICSAPTWLGQERRRSRRRKSYFPQPSPLAMNNPDASSEDVAGNAVGGDNPNLLSIHPGCVTPGSAQPFNRRSLRSSRRRKRPSSCGPSNRRSLRDKLPHHKGSSNSQPSSPTTLISPIITVDPPNHSGVARPDKLDVPDCYGSVTLQVPERTVSFSQMNDSTSNLSQYSDSSNPGSAVSFYSPNSNDTSASHSAHGLKPDWARDGAYDTDSLDSKILPEISIPLKRPLRRLVNQDSVEARIASADIKSIVRPKQLSAMQNQSQLKQKNHTLLPCQEIIQKDDSSGIQLHARPHVNDSLILPGIDNVDKIAVKIETSQNDHLRLPHKDSVDSDENSGNHLLGLATGGDSLDVAKTTMQCVMCNKNSVDYNSDSTPEQTEESADELDHSIKLIENSVKQIVLNDKRDAKTEPVVVNVNGKITLEEFCDKSSSKHNSVEDNSMSASVKSQLEDICKPYVVDLGVPCSTNNSPKYIETNIDAPNDEIVSIPPSNCRKSSGNSLPSFVMPNTPTRQKFTSPIARIDSFHSEDFDNVDDMKMKCQSNSTTPGSVNTPTFPCFAYKLQLHKKKNGKLKSSKQKEENQINVNDEKNDRCSRNDIEPTCSDPLLVGSGSDKSNSDENSDKPLHSSKAKIHPMDKDDKDSTKSCKSLNKSKCTVDSDPICNDIQVKKQQNLIGKPCNSQPSDNKKTCVKYSPWKHGFVQFLKKKKQGQRQGSRNNNDSFRSNNHTLLKSNVSNHNGHARCSYKALPNSDDNGLEAETQFQTKSLAVRPDTLEIRSSPVPGLAPAQPATKMFDFTVLSTESPQANSCLLSWKGCRDCTVGHVPSDEEDSECTFRFEQSVDVAIKTNMTIQNVQDAKTYTAYKCSHS
ncbi:uncharacterized protein LOC134681014 isoform X2 [Mytilus trossulus]|uniref:uncharacterized protein LOC134681014 isoform X2 n=1 Tax=Mytilus trossulus TaxID=6551 RepID=UPI0030043D90